MGLNNNIVFLRSYTLGCRGFSNPGIRVSWKQDRIWSLWGGGVLEKLQELQVLSRGRDGLHTAIAPSPQQLASCGASLEAPLQACCMRLARPRAQRPVSPLPANRDDRPVPSPLRILHALAVLGSLISAHITPKTKASSPPLLMALCFSTVLQHWHFRSVVPLGPNADIWWPSKFSSEQNDVLATLSGVVWPKASGMR